MSNPLVTSWRHMPSSGHADDTTTPATRHLCAGVYVDRRFRNRVIWKVHNDSRRRVAPSYGFDLVPIVRHAWLSWWLDVAQRAVMVGCLLGGLVRSGPLAVVLVGSATGLGYLLCKAARLGAELCRLHLKARAQLRRRNRRRRAESPMALLRTRKWHLKAVLAGCIAIAALPTVVANALDTSLGDAVPAARTMGGYLVVSAAVAGALRQLLLNAVYHAGSLRPMNLTAREQVIDAQQSHPCVIYQRPGRKLHRDFLDFSALDDVPTTFIGSGDLVDRWLPPLTVRLVTPDTDGMGRHEYAIPPFRAPKLVEELRSALQQVGMDEGPVNLPGLQVRDRIYVAETDLSSDRDLLGDDLDRGRLSDLIDQHQSARHHFLETSMPIAGGELVTTVFVRATVKARCLTLDVATCALTRTPAEYQRIDAFAENGTGAVLRRAARSVCRLPAEVGQLWRLLEVPVVLVGALGSVRDRTLVPRRRITVGPRLSVREEVADTWENARLDRIIIYEHMRVIEHRILKTTEDFLEAHGVDTSMFRKQATQIINNRGFYAVGGENKVGQVISGENAQGKQFSVGPEVEGDET